MKDKKNNSKFHIPELRAGFRILLYLCMVLLGGLSLYVSMSDEISMAVAIPCYVLALLGLMAGSIYLVSDIKRFNGWIKSLIVSNQYTGKVASNYRLRTFVMLIPGALANIFYAIVNAITGITAHSAWFGSFAAYYILISILRVRALLEARKLRTADAEQRKRSEARIYFRYSQLFLLFGWITFGLTILLYHSQGSKSYPDLMIYAMAAYTFFRVGMSIRALIMTRKENSPLLMIVRKLGYMDACLSILILQVAMFGEFGAGTDSSMVARANAVTGIVVTLMILGMGIQGIISYKKR